VTLNWRDDAPANQLKLAVGRCLIAVMDYSKWIELGLVADKTTVIEGHPRLLRSLHFGDEDYDGNVLDLVSDVLDEQPDPSIVEPDPWSAFPLETPAPVPFPITVRFRNLDVVADFIALPAWLAENDPQMLDRLMAEASGDATLPDGTVLSAAESAAVRLEIGEMRRQIERIRRDHGSDHESAVGQAKDLIETVCKTILGMTGDADNERPTVPALVKRTLTHLGIDPEQVDDDTNPVDARAARRMLGGVSNILSGADELRNARGTGHGRSGATLIDAALARLAVGSVLVSVVYLLEVFEARTAGTDAPLLQQPSTTAEGQGQLEVGAFVMHATFGEGRVEALSGESERAVATVDFGGQTGVKRLLVRHAGLVVTR
jgi:hypothetical protein